MTDPTVPDSQDTSTDDTSTDVDQELDTTSGDRDPLSTDDGLTAAAATMPAVDEDRPVDDTGGSGGETVKDVDLPGLQVDADGADPVADLAQPGDQED